MLQNISYHIKQSGTLSLLLWKQNLCHVQKTFSQHKPVALEVNRKTVKSGLQRGVNSAQNLLSYNGIMFHSGGEGGGEKMF